MVFHFLHEWELVTPNYWVVNIVGKGYALPFLEFPPPISPGPSICSEDHLLLLRQEVQVLLSKGTVELVPEQERGQGCYLRYFLIPKKDGQLRPILDLRILNWFPKQEKFKMLTLALVLLALNKEDWMVSGDLQDAYFHIPILKSHRRYQTFRNNLLELRAIPLAVKAFLPSLRGQSVQVLTVNTTTMWYINKQGGVDSYLLFREALRLWSWAQDHQICLVANHLAGVLNVLADSLSRHFSADHEWRLHPDLVLHIFRVWGFPRIDEFATRDNMHCPSFCSLQYPVQGALGDTFQMSWCGQLLYAFPPYP
ncbi:hypothetical protein NDU88_003931 [Pleurodeles waltl]|uniref:Reverse transcriptase domain-containing protein n=1 Tax=Pleurodeles waltl TaxID=8319 RepID=A0AAV7T6V8_PLEWA|nr:hypothetical protein NDU88_003931 [Pleurodeles waltl]